ncbi:hypothetical protein [Chromobacterium haemolyticum]|uniref:hypothetical protein n=1 Tax=Chromobacterium haemolyticum TaxID=394935 RepID=UPI0011311AB1|nr:hypothetical protein [Chromobacterium haemolyticum]
MSATSEIHKITLSNSIVFLNKAIAEIASHQDSDDTPFSIEIATISVALLQISFELSLISYAIIKKGITSILLNKDKNLPDDEIRNLFINNELKTRTFSQIISEIQSENKLFNEDELYHIDTFQNIRNKLVHVGFNFYEGDLYDLKYDVIYFLSHPLIKLISLNSGFSTPAQLIQHHIKPQLYKKLIAFPPYVSHMKRLASQWSPAFKCLSCGNNSLSQDEGVCYICSAEYECDEFIHCGRCGENRSVIYDYLNIELNANMARGLCLACGEDDVVFRCPKCKVAYGIESSLDTDKCTPDKCAFFGS